jgi:A/G-specific adenine glycosylase
VDVTRELLEWYRGQARVLPWRREPRDPYLVLVSELMLQQTQVDRVVPRFESFVARFPDLQALAAATEDEVLAEWSGLGYYSRARRLRQLAVELAGAPLPTVPAALVKLPGIGPYTAAAIASLAFGRPEPVLDGNVMRVGARVRGLDEDPHRARAREQLLAWVRSLMHEHPPGAINEALMELGALVCLPRAPACQQCPLAPVCQGRARGDPEVYPPPRQTRTAVAMHWVAACVADAGGRWLLSRVAEGPILRGLWLPPLAPLADGTEPIRVAQGLVPWRLRGDPIQHPPVRHSITYRRITVTPVQLAVAGRSHSCDGWRAVDPTAPDLPTSSLLAKLVKACGAP